MEDSEADAPARSEVHLWALAAPARSGSALPLPLWERCIAVTRGSNPRRVECTDDRQTYLVPSKTSEPPRQFVTIDRCAFDVGPLARDIGEGAARAQQAKKWAERFRVPICPMPVAHSDFAAKVEKLPVAQIEGQFRSLQVIVKLSSIFYYPLTLLHYI